jgi:hypothetical protein
MGIDRSRRLRGVFSPQVDRDSRLVTAAHTHPREMKPFALSQREHWRDEVDCGESPYSDP